MNKERPWLNEPDFIKWIDSETGYHCVISRTPEMLHLCGYVRVPRSHPLYGKHTDCRKTWRVQVHGGVTFADRLRKPSGAPMRGHWFGFDCAHYMDLTPGFLKMFPDNLELTRPLHQIYRDVAYVKIEVTSLAKQLKRMQK